MIGRFLVPGALGYIGWYVWTHYTPAALFVVSISILGGAALLIYPHIAHVVTGRGRCSSLATTRLDKLTPGDFELEVTRLMGVFAGANNVRRVGHSGDGGIDVLMLDHGHVVGVVQCKHRINPHHTVGPEVIRDLDSARTHAGAKYACVATNGRFTSGAISLARSYNIVLLDGQSLVRLRSRANVR